MAPITLFHRTTPAAAKAIARGGFRDSSGSFGTSREHRGVWLSDVPLDVNEGAEGEVLLRVTLACDETALADHEWVQAGAGYREWLVPSAIVNPIMTVERLSQADEDEIALRAAKGKK
jgi:hypothetical protein